MTNKISVPLLALALLAPLSSAEAGGERETEVIFVNMTPDAETGGESTKCAKTFLQTFRAEDWMTIIKKGETKIRTATGVPKGGANFMTWKAKQFSPLTRDNPRHDEFHDYEVAMVLVDCRPAKSMLDVFVVTPGNGEYRLSLRGVKFTKKLTRAFAQRVMKLTSDGFYQ